MRKYFVSIMIIVLLILSFTTSEVRGDSKTTKVATFPYGITTIFSSGKDVFVGTKQGFFVSENYGKTFVERDRGLASLKITSVVFVKGIIFLGTSDSGLYVSKDMGKTWQSLMDKLNCPTVSSIKTNGKRIFVTSFCSGFHFSEDLGNTWEDRNGGLPTLKTTTFLETPQGRCFLGTDQYGLFYSDTLGKSCSWDKFFEKYYITSLSYIGDVLLVGTNLGMFTGGIESDDFKKLNFIGGNPYILHLIRVNGNVLTAVKGLGLFVTNDGKHFVRMNCCDFENISAMYYSKDDGKLYIGNDQGELYFINLSQPFLITDTSLNLGFIPKGEKISGKISVVNLGMGDLKVFVSAPYFINFKQSTFTNPAVLTFSIDTTDLSIGSYTETVKIKSGSDTMNCFISFKVEPSSSIVLKLKVGSNIAYINSRKVSLDVTPFIDSESNRTLVPVRFISEAFGAKVEWDPKERKVSIKKGPSEHHDPVLIELWIGSKKTSVNLKSVVIDVAPKIVPPGRTVVPLRFIAETLGSTVKWNPITREITMIYNP